MVCNLQQILTPVNVFCATVRHLEQRLVMNTFMEPDILWLTTVNVLLGVAIVGCALVIALHVAREIIIRRKARKREAQIPADYLWGLKNLGVTLPDGGEKIDEMNEELNC